MMNSDQRFASSTALLLKRSTLVRVFFVWALAFALLTQPVSPAMSQETGQSSEEKTVDGEEAKELRPELRTLPPAYESLMLRLAEALGALHYLRNLCGEEEGQTWREQMEQLIIAEAPNEQRKAQLIANFNRGFRGYSEIYRECTKPAVESANQFLQQAMRLTAQIPNRFGR
jgi:uncharacterized protein (TIGR02301 family)